VSLVLGVREVVDHLSVKCLFASAIWYEIFNWLGVSMTLSEDLFSMLEKCCFYLRREKTVKWLLLIWNKIFGLYKRLVMNYFLLEDSEGRKRG